MNCSDRVRRRRGPGPVATSLVTTGCRATTGCRTTADCRATARSATVDVSASARAASAPAASVLVVAALVVAGLAIARSTRAAEPLWATIDGQVARRAAAARPELAASLSGPASDSQFLRRVYLDLAGEIPPAWLAREFPADTDGGKRERLVERLLQGPAFARRMREAWTVMLLERHEGKAVADDAWEAYLESAFLSGKPWNELARELVAADGFDDATRPAIRFLADGTRSDPHTRTQDFARLFLGMNLQCAQCHDHPTIADYKQSHYFGLFAFLSPTKLARDKQEQPRLIDAVVQAKADFVSVFHPEDKRAIGPRLLDEPEVAIPAVAKGDEFAQPPANGLPGVPRFQPRKLLAEQLSGSESARRRFARNAVNRVWFLFMGRGLVHPLDLDHSANPPSHPELLDRLTADFIASGYDLRWLVRSICLSETYQRSAEFPRVAASAASSGLAPAKPQSVLYVAAIARPLSPEQLARSLVQATRHPLAGVALQAPQWPRFVDRSMDRSMESTAMNVSGASAVNVGGAAIAASTAAAPGAAAKAMPEKPFTLKDYLNRRIDPPARWRDVMVVFAGVFGHPAGQAEVDFRPSVEQALFLSNDPLVRRWLDPSERGLIADLLASESSDEACIDEIFLSFLSRWPDPKERAAAIDWLRQSDNRPEALRDLCLALICSAEFRFV